jgi:hypothetical protein
MHHQRRSTLPHRLRYSQRQSHIHSLQNATLTVLTLANINAGFAIRGFAFLNPALQMGVQYAEHCPGGQEQGPGKKIRLLLGKLVRVVGYLQRRCDKGCVRVKTYPCPGPVAVLIMWSMLQKKAAAMILFSTRQLCLPQTWCIPSYFNCTSFPTPRDVGDRSFLQDIYIGPGWRGVV